MAVSTDDYVAVADHLARYCHRVDDGDEDGWTALWTADGIFTGVSPEPIVGREALKSIPRMIAGAKTRHLIACLACDYVDGHPDRILATYYNHVTNWLDGCKPVCMATCRVELVRNGHGWLVARNDSELFPG